MSSGSVRRASSVFLSSLRWANSPRPRADSTKATAASDGISGKMAAATRATVDDTNAATRTGLRSMNDFSFSIISPLGLVLLVLLGYETLNIGLLHLGI